MKISNQTTLVRFDFLIYLSSLSSLLLPLPAPALRFHRLQSLRSFQRDIPIGLRHGDHGKTK
ncbi:unnamed protein product, partial [Vitis vinifera]